MKYTILTRALALLFLAAAPAAIAQTPALLNYQGRVQTGTPPADFNGTGQFKFALVDQSPVPFVQATATVIFLSSQSLNGAGFFVTNPGTGYTTPPQVTVGPPNVPGGVQATVTATVSGGSVTGFTVVTPGSGYTSNPTLTIAPPPARTPTIIWNNNGPAPADPVNAVSLAVTNGLYSVLLGDTSIANMAAIPPAAFSRPDVRLRVWFNGTQLSPDQRLAPTAYLSELPALPSLSLRSGALNFENTSNPVPYMGFDFDSAGDALRLRSNIGGISLNTTQMTLQRAGNVGIGTTSPTQAKLVVNGAAGRSRAGGVGYYGQDYYNYGTADTYGTAQTSIWASNEVVASAFIAMSDSRIKSLVGRSNATADLAKLRGIEITDYTYIDKVARGGRPQKKVIAQQVEQVFPQAVNRQVDTVPDIFKKAAVDGSWIKLATDLKAGERVKFVTPENEQSIHEVLEVKEGAFRTAFAPKSREIFVYGREVKDFRTVDYEAIAMLNVSATQELARQLDAEKADTLAKDREITALKERLADLEAKDAARDAKLAALMELMEDRSGDAKAATVSTVATQP